MTALSGTSPAGTLISLVLTLAVFSYLLGDNPVFRLALHVFTGAAVGYYAVLILEDVVKPHIWERLWGGEALERGIAGFLFLLGLFLILKVIPGIPGRFSEWGNPALAYIVGIGAATIVGGALTGTLIPQAWALMQVFNAQGAGAAQTPLQSAGQLLNGGIVLVGALASLLYFQFHGRSETQDRFSGLRKGFLAVGEVFLAVALGCINAGIILAALSALTERLNFIVEIIRSIVK